MPIENLTVKPVTFLKQVSVKMIFLLIVIRVRLIRRQSVNVGNVYDITLRKVLYQLHNTAINNPHSHKSCISQSTAVYNDNATYKAACIYLLLSIFTGFFLLV